ncbi:16S rRNA m(2)G 1207 methyltransferase /23S rRNA m(2)G-1835 methyltransferase [Friedmanniella luteola]|uniref:16S rRNA m(2)G 1207 methyltransferase /23S rRNA m(2)G-1835 methyltransferase n=1 Tax=Friedmanniella luteola TaxID=546871 RepID=A0A1H1ZW29_9ACTN|nr:methyltransferase [Friedmanniella luteola]SDT37863.1 16S rRNA m(2)G 1207 methyltransferase /23S rRNA m(2)G-1835 methyltransferase [Friedmanniella luteola]
MEALGDPVDGILLRETEALPPAPGAVVVLEDQSGALTAGVAALRPGVPVRALVDSWTDQQVVAAAVTGVPQVTLLDDLGPELLGGAVLVVMRLPKGLAALDAAAEAVARWADPAVVLLAGGRVKHMSRGMNDVLARHFGAVRASLGAQKSRVLVAREPRPATTSRYPLAGFDADLGLQVRAHGGAFAGPAVDLGTRSLIGFAGSFPADARRVVDLGCGTGLLAVTAARTLPGATVLALDASRAAVLSAAATAEANGVADRVEVRRTHLAGGVPDGSVDLVLCNPPFHRGNSRDSAVAFELLADAARVLRPGGELWTVYNSHLPYLRTLRRLVGSTAVVGQNTGFTVTRSVRSA